jgi:hypothetical protein
MISSLQRQQHSSRVQEQRHGKDEPVIGQKPAPIKSLGMFRVVVIYSARGVTSDQSQ